MRSINSYNRIVIKIGSAVLASPYGKVNQSVLAAISEDIAWLLKNNKEVLVVSSGAIALGRKKIKLSENLSLAESQALAAHGQIELMSAWKKHLNKFSIPIVDLAVNNKQWEHGKCNKWGGKSAFKFFFEAINFVKQEKPDAYPSSMKMTALQLMR